MKKLFFNKWLIIVVIVGIGLYIFAFMDISHSEAFRFVKSTLESSPAIVERIGPVENVKLDVLKGGRIRVVGDNQTARMVVDVTGTKGDVTVNLYALKTNGVWTIREATINGQPIVLTNNQ
ncbi:MAG: cytochrome c oxidase assembly factor Coa1 family protein [Gammaproteobacteria bacterium]